MDYANEILQNFQMFLDSHNVSQSVAAAVASVVLWVIFAIWKLGKMVFGEKVMSQTANLIMQALKNEGWKWGMKHGQPTGNSIVLDRGDQKFIANFKNKKYFLLEKQEDGTMSEVDLTSLLNRRERRKLNKQIRTVTKNLQEKDQNMAKIMNAKTVENVNDKIVEILQNKPKKMEPKSNAVASSAVAEATKPVTSAEKMKKIEQLFASLKSQV